MKPSDIKASLLAQLAAAPPPAMLDLPGGGAAMWQKWFDNAQPDQRAGMCESRRCTLAAAVGYLTLRAGPSTFTVLNTRLHRDRFLARVMASSGFKDRGQVYRAPGRLTIAAATLTAEEVAQAQRDYLADTEDLC